MIDDHNKAIWPVGGGETGALIRARDWHATSLGPTENWPQSLRTSIDLMLAAKAEIVVMWGRDFITFYNDAYAPTIGNKHPAAIGRPASEVWAESWDDLGSLLSSVRATGETVAAHDRPFQIDRYGFMEEVFFDISYSPIRDETNAVAGVLCIVSETTKRVNTARQVQDSQAKLREEQSFTRLVLDSTTDGFYSVARDGVTTYCNASFLKMLGYTSADEVIGRKLHGEIHHSHANGTHYPVENCPIYIAASQGKPAQIFGERFFRKDGSSFPVDYRAEPLWVDGELQGAVCTFTDISARIDSEDALRISEALKRESLERLELALNSGAVLGTWVWEIPADRLTGDDRFARTFGLDPKALHEGVGLSDVKQSIHPDDIARVEKLIGEAMARGGNYSAEYRLQQPDGSSRWIEASGRVELDADHKPVRFPGVLVDIDERKRMEASSARESSARQRVEENLQQTNDQLRLAEVSCGIGVFQMDVASDVMTTSPEFCRLFGLPVSPQMSVTVLEEMVVPDDSDERSSAHKRTSGEMPLEVEYRIRRADNGEVRWLSRRAEFEQDADGKPRILRGVIQDITTRKIAETTLRESEAQFRALAQAMPNQVWTASSDGLLNWVNEKIKGYSGLPESELLGNNWAQIVHQDDLSRVAALWQDALTTRTGYETEFRIRRADGAYRWHIVRAVPLGSDGGVRWVGTNTDIDDQKAAQVTLAKINVLLEERVAERTNDLNRMWRLSTDIMLVSRFDGTLTAVNPAWKTLLGWDETEVLGKAFFEFVHADDQETTYQEAEKLGQGMTTLHFENRYLHKDGSSRTIAWAAVPDDEFIHAVGRDISAEKAAAETLRQTEAQLRQSHKMEAIGQLTGGIAHDFNNLLQGITGSIEVVKRLIAAGRSDNVDRFMDSATNSAHRAAALIHRLLAFSRQQTLDNQPVDVNQLVVTMSELLRRTLGEHIDLQVQLTPEMWPAFSDANQLESALLNLAINARDAMPDGGRLTIRTSNMTLDRLYAGQLDGLKPGDYALVSVTDTGVGMSPETLAKAFDPFFTTKPLGQGTGLGLSMIYGFAKQSGGHVRIDSEPGTGTTIKLYLPRADCAVAESADLQTRELPQGAGETVLLVEDDPTVRLLVLEVLRELGYSALEATNGLEAVPILQSSRKIDLLISDVGLPGLNGRQVAEIGRQHRPGLQVLFITGYAEHMAARHEPIEGGVRMISKPFAIDELALKIRESFRDVQANTQVSDRH